MILSSPFCISARLAPAVRIGTPRNVAAPNQQKRGLIINSSVGWLSYVNGQFIIDLPDGSEHVIDDFRPAPGSGLAEQFAGVLTFMEACAESRKYARSRGKDEMDGENSDLFPPNVGEFCEAMSDEISMLRCEIEESPEPLIS